MEENVLTLDTFWVMNICNWWVESYFCSLRVQFFVRDCITAVELWLRNENVGGFTGPFNTALEVQDINPSFRNQIIKL